MGLLIVGSLGLDSVTTPFDKVEDALGGSATYISLAASYFSGPVEMVGVVGKDFPRKYIQLLEDHNINLEGLQIEEGKTFRWGGKYHYDLNVRDTLFTELNVFESLYALNNSLSATITFSSQYISVADNGPILSSLALKTV